MMTAGGAAAIGGPAEGTSPRDKASGGGIRRAVGERLGDRTPAVRRLVRSVSVGLAVTVPTCRDKSRREGSLNVITLPADWANYGTIMKDFTAKYGIKITDENPDGSSQDELNAIQQTKGQDRAPDVVDVGTVFAAKGQTSGDWAPYKVATWSDIPDSSKEATGLYHADYGGFAAIGYDSARVKNPPTSFKSLLTGPYKNMVALNGSLTQAGAAFAGVYAAALASGGSFGNIAPGVAYFKAAEAGGQLRPGHRQRVDDGERPDPDPGLVGLPAGLRGRRQVQEP